MKGRVTEKRSDMFVVDCQDKTYQLYSRGKNKQTGIFVGDEVEFETDKLIIENIYPRKSLLIRPNLANLSKLFIVIAPVPKPDFSIVDKMILFSLFYQIEPILVVNKTDLCDDDFLENVKKIYSNVLKIVFTSASKNIGLEDLHNEFKGSICALAGQSAVGKSAIIKKIYPQSEAIVGEISKRIQRGKNTTRSVNLYKLEKDTFIADTPGFSSLDILYLPIKYFELCYFYPDFLPFHEKCKYKSCTHSNEETKDCAVKMAVENGQIDKDRYERYIQMYDILQKHWAKTHG